MKLMDGLVLGAITFFLIVRVPDWTGSAEGLPLFPMQEPEYPLQTQQDPIASPDALLLKFERTVFATEDDRERDSVLRWEKPVKLSLSGTFAPRYRSYVASTADHLARLTNRSIHPVDLDSSPDFTAISALNDSIHPFKADFFVMVDSVQTIKTTFTSHVDLSEIANNRNVNGMALTYSFGKYPSDGIAFALAVAKARANDDATRSTLLEEISQAFGAVNDTDDVSPSLWSDGRPNYQRLPLNDQIVLRMLYDPLLYSGMNRASAMAIARQRLPGLIEAARENGETALYQR